jgi:subtilisin
MENESVQRELENYGFAQVVVALAPPAAATTIIAKTDAGAAVLSHFLDRVPDAAGGVQAAFTKRRSKQAVPSGRQFPRLGVALGYVDRTGMRRLSDDATVGAVHRAEPLSLIRPVMRRSARSRSEMAWGLRHLKVRELWDQGLTGKGVRVGHLDTGVDATHPAVSGRVVDFMETDVTGDRVPGATPRDSDTEYGHGTHTAGIICGGKVGNISIGVAPEADLLSGLVLDGSVGGNPLLRVFSGMEWALEKRVKILNMSLGFTGYSPFFLDVTRRLRQQGVLPVFAIGNEGVGTSRSPGNYAEALSVGACDLSHQVPRFSSSMTFIRPDEPQQPNVVAPGKSVVSAKPGGGVSSLDGTSVAAPHVAGVAALLFEARPTASVAELEAAIQSSCTPLPNDSALRFGFGLVDAPAALQALRS